MRAILAAAPELRSFTLSEGAALLPKLLWHPSPSLQQGLTSLRLEGQDGTPLPPAATAIAVASFPNLVDLVLDDICLGEEQQAERLLDTTKGLANLRCLELKHWRQLPRESLGSGWTNSLANLTVDETLRYSHVHPLITHHSPTLETLYLPYILNLPASLPPYDLPLLRNLGVSLNACDHHVDFCEAFRLSSLATVSANISAVWADIGPTLDKLHAAVVHHRATLQTFDLMVSCYQVKLEHEAAVRELKKVCEGLKVSFGVEWRERDP